MCVCSRNFGIVVDGVRTSAMVPYADMLNHYRPRSVAPVTLLTLCNTS